jgi:hypothetical protein
MKKVCLFLMLGVFTLGASGFKAETSFTPEPEPQEVDCLGYAAGVWLQYYSLGMRGEDLENIHWEAYNRCIQPTPMFDF